MVSLSKLPNGLIEDAAAACFLKAHEDHLAVGKTVPPETMAYIMGLSQAISLKRIADALWGTEGTSGLLQLLNPLDVRNNY